VEKDVRCTIDIAAKVANWHHLRRPHQRHEKRIMRARYRSLVGLYLLLLAGVFAAPHLLASNEQQAAAKAKTPRTDDFGDPLPDGVFYRLGTTRLRHADLQGLIFSKDGKQVLSHGGTCDLRVWEVATGKLLQRFPFSHDFDCLIASPDDQLLAGTWKNSVFLLEKTTGKQLARWDREVAWHSLAFAKDGKTLVGLAADLVAYRWDIASRKETGRQPLLDVPGAFKEAHHRFWRLTPDGAIAAGKPEWETDFGRTETREPWHFWDTVSGKECRPSLTTMLLKRPWVAKDPWCFSPDGRTLAMAGAMRWPEVWDTATGKRQPWDRPDDQIGAGGLDHADVMTFHPSGTMLALSSRRTVAIRDLATGKQLWAKEDLDTEDTTVLAFSPDGKTLGVGSHDSVRFLNHRAQLRSCSVCSSSRGQAIAFA
jgi:WD40 repeat protein